MPDLHQSCWLDYTALILILNWPGGGEVGQVLLSGLTILRIINIPRPPLLWKLKGPCAQPQQALLSRFGMCFWSWVFNGPFTTDSYSHSGMRDSILNMQCIMSSIKNQGPLYLLDPTSTLGASINFSSSPIHLASQSRHKPKYLSVIALTGIQLLNKKESQFVKHSPVSLTSRRAFSSIP